MNLAMPSRANSMEFHTQDAAHRFYSYFGDDYEHLAFVFSEYPFIQSNSAYHLVFQNKISGIGLQLFDRSAEWGSGGRLEGVETYLGTLDNTGSNHELSHQWSDYFDWPGMSGINASVHTPLWGHFESPVAQVIAPNLRLRPLGGVEWEAVQAPEPTQISPLQAYAMGRLAAGAVPPLDVFENQNRFVFRPGERVSGATRHVTIDDIVAHHGPRIGPTSHDGAPGHDPGVARRTRHPGGDGLLDAPGAAAGGSVSDGHDQ